VGDASATDKASSDPDKIIPSSKSAEPGGKLSRKPIGWPFRSYVQRHIPKPLLHVDLQVVRPAAYHKRDELKNACLAAKIWPGHNSNTTAEREGTVDWAWSDIPGTLTDNVESD
jgi:hypothetical protein